MTVARSRSMLEQLEAEARARGLLLRLQVGRRLGLWSLRLVVARQAPSGSLLLLGEMKGWAYPATTGLQLDTMRVMPKAPAGVGDLVWAATMANAAAVAAIAMVGAIVLGLAASIIALVVYTGGVGAAAILAFGAAFLMLGAGVALAAMGVKTFVEASQGVSFAAMAELASGLYMVGGAMALLGLPPSLLGAMVLSVLSANMIALSAAAEKLPFVADMMEMLGTVIEAVTAPLRVMESVFETLTDPQRIADLAVGFVAIADAIDKIPTTKAVAMTATLGATAAAATATAVVGGGAAMATNVVSAMGGAQAAPTQVQAQERPYQVTINLQMGDEIIKTEVVDIVGGIAKRAIGLM